MTVRNLGQAGAALDATNTGLVPVSEAVWFPGVVNNNIETVETIAAPGQLAVYLLGDFPTPTGTQTVCSMWDVTPKFFRFDFRSNRIGQLWLDLDSGQAAHAATDGFAIAAVGIGATADPVAGEVLFYETLDGTTWTQVGAAVAFTPSPLLTGSSRVIIGHVDDVQNAKLTVRALRISADLNIPTGTPFFTFDAATDLPTDPAATEFICTTGQEITVNRGASGPVTVLAPGPVLVNPDETDAANILSSVALPVAASQDFVMGYVGQLNSSVGEQTFMGTGTVDPIATMRWANETGEIRCVIRDDVPTTYDLNPGDIPAPDIYAMYAVFLTLDRQTGLFSRSVFNTGGLTIPKVSIDASAAIGITSITASPLFTEVAGTFSAVLWDKGVGIAPSDETLAQWAAFLLRGYT